MTDTTSHGNGLDVAGLRSRVAGPVLTPGDDGFADEVAAWIRNFDHTPQVAVGVTSAADVVAAVNFAREHSLPVRVQATGHASHFAVTDGVLIVTKRMTGVAIDAVTRTATIAAGAPWGAVVAAAAEVGLAPIAGSSPTVGAVGFLLGGGVGPLARSFGFSSDYVESVEVVTGGGELVTASSDQNPELFWALRGGRAGLGVVTEIRVRLVELESLYGGSLFFDADAIEPALRAWVDYTKTAQSNVTTSIAILRMPDLPFIPEP
ncbi:MAG: FAD-binding protein, partial [Leifsonia sp.]